MDGREGTNWFSTKFVRLGAATPCGEDKTILKPPKVIPKKIDCSLLKKKLLCRTLF